MSTQDQAPEFTTRRALLGFISYIALLAIILSPFFVH